MGKRRTKNSIVLAVCISLICLCGVTACGQDSPKSSSASIDPASVGDRSLSSTSSSASKPKADDLRSQLNIEELYFDDFNHGKKSADFQKYIVLHDTEGGGSPTSVVNSWENNGQHIAAHFVVGKDGSIVQCVPLDAIAHHVGWGSNGHNAKFGVEDESRDDKIGQKATSSYSDYGMNSFSIGIEMIHAGGDGDYPEAQLAAIDKLIAYRDAYYGGNPGEIIDHKMWRIGNSDTSAEFAAYLDNYRDHRSHN